jgi:hypothetical protein
MARVNDLSREQAKVAGQILQLRLLVGLSRTGFAKIINMSPGNVRQRESGNYPWRDSEVQSSVAALTKHLKKSLKESESISRNFSPKPTTKIQ